MKSTIIRIIVALLTVFLLTTLLHAQEDRFSFKYFSDYLYISDTQITEFDEVLWFWQRDIMNGPVHVNTILGILNQATFNAPVTTSDEDFVGYGMPICTYPPAFRWPEAQFPDDLSFFIEEAENQETAFLNENGLYQFRCFGNHAGWQWYKWPVGEEFSADIVVDEGFILYGQNRAIYFDGSLEIASESTTGTGTIACRNEMRILDNLKYTDVNFQDLEIPLDSENKYGYICDGNILIWNTEANGRGNGLSVGTHDSSSVVLTGAFLAMNEMFTFHQQNNSWDDYIFCEQSGINPDERGTVHLIGSLANKRVGYIHRSTCGGTGYDKDYRYDFRFLESPPPFYPEIDWNGNLIVDEQIWENAEIDLDTDDQIMVAGRGDLIISDNTTINKDYQGYGNQTLIKSYFNGRVFIEADPENPAVINLDEDFDDQFKIFDADGSPGNIPGSVYDTEWTGLQINGRNWRTDTPHILTGCSFAGETITLDAVHDDPSSQRVIRETNFYGNTLIAWDDVQFTPVNLMKNCIVMGELRGRIENIDRCNFLSFAGNPPSVLLNPVVQTNIQNSYFQSENRIIEIGMNVFLDYCAYNTDDAATPFSRMDNLGHNMLAEVEPMFVDFEDGNYNLLPESPLIDAGNPLSELDPDGTVADIGALYFNQLGVATKSDEIPEEFFVSNAWPNPFNSHTEINFSVNRKSSLIFVIYDLLGRKIRSYDFGKVGAGNYSLNIDLSLHPSGLYFLVAHNDNQKITRKLLYIK